MTSRPGAPRRTFTPLMAHLLALGACIAERQPERDPTSGAGRMSPAPDVGLDLPGLAPVPPEVCPPPTTSTRDLAPASDTPREAEGRTSSARLTRAEEKRARRNGERLAALRRPR